MSGDDSVKESLVDFVLDSAFFWLHLRDEELILNVDVVAGIADGIDVGFVDALLHRVEVQETGAPLTHTSYNLLIKAINFSFKRCKFVCTWQVTLGSRLLTKDGITTSGSFDLGSR